MKKIDVKVCLGTTCFVMGASNLKSLTEIALKKYSDRVEVSASSCLGVCSTNWEFSKAPYVKVGAEIIQEATVDKVVAEIERQLEKND